MVGLDPQPQCGLTQADCSYELLGKPIVTPLRLYPCNCAGIGRPRTDMVHFAISSWFPGHTPHNSRQGSAEEFSDVVVNPFGSAFVSWIENRKAFV
ncbi:hypothetical protein L914_21765 [Phytophthora nicotianae]|uniref:Uncharacterized protein n=1 Tax=Phytophthora nicotianae TaxID=4792 RepID=W2M2L6_PHYNI|nr:hypothetical protein L914_21765 [Phytophthora nicotianae]